MLPSRETSNKTSPFLGKRETLRQSRENSIRERTSTDYHGYRCFHRLFPVRKIFQARFRRAKETTIVKLTVATSFYAAFNGVPFQGRNERTCNDFALVQIAPIFSIIAVAECPSFHGGGEGKFYSMGRERKKGNEGERKKKSNGGIVAPSIKRFTSALLRAPLDQ